MDETRSVSGGSNTRPEENPSNITTERPSFNRRNPIDLFVARTLIQKFDC